ncbi:RNA polymerase sigma factor [Sandaracinus amylolyticus]|uniref:RNA polymerase sigma factor n=1 Tax=Sandaracinus amylolyticus TaxID=927083 RepID=UPI0012EEA151|nr:RNA polymerase sigma factor [Sandaracinus amylolyticus]
MRRDVAMRVIDGGGADAGRAESRSPVDQEERALLTRAAAGDDAAVRRLYRDHVDRVFRTVARILGSSDPDVEDVVQQTFLAALDGADRFDGRSKLSTWIIGIATRRALDQARDRWRRSRWQRVTEWVGLGRAAGRPDDTHDSKSLAEWALAKLTPDQRTVFVLHEVEGHTLAEVSAMTGTGISTLHARLVAGRKRLDAALASIGAETNSLPGGGGDDHDAT